MPSELPILPVPPTLATSSASPDAPTFARGWVLPRSLSKTLRTVLRVVAAVGGGYALCAVWVALLSVALPRVTGLSRSEAVVLSAMLGFVVYLLVLLWAFSARSLGRLWVMLTAGITLAYGLTQLLQA
jgi:hypothetical protein